MTDELALLRGAIDSTDERITELLKKRMELCAAVGEYKRKNGIAVQDRTREEKLLSRVEQNAGAFAPYIRPVYDRILEQSREYQTRQMRCGLAGEKLPYSFSPDVRSTPEDHEYGLTPGQIAEIRETVERGEKNILFVGMPGCGKSSVGAALAEKLERPFTDTDKLIEERSGLPIPEIFARFGEEHFRRLEHAVLEDVTKESGRVIAVGGGAVTRQENLGLLRRSSLVIWLQRSIDSLPTEGRPLSRPDVLAAMYAERAPIYRAVSDVSFENAAPSPAESAERMIEEWKL